MTTSADEILEYKAQLADVEALLEESPNDSSLLSLKRDLLELLQVSASASSCCATTEVSSANHVSHGNTEEAMSDAWAENALDQALKDAVGSSIGHGETAPSHAPVASEPVLPKLIEKKKKVKAVFEIPKHLEISESDTTAEKNKKKRAIKALKSKWKESVKEVESEKKQKSWQSFQKKRKVKGESIFKTGDTAVGVVSAAGRKLTDFEDRKRHKHAP